jgi:uncharacterized membrane protein YhfC
MSGPALADRLLDLPAAIIPIGIGIAAACIALAVVAHGGRGSAPLYLGFWLVFAALFTALFAALAVSFRVPGYRALAVVMPTVLVLSAYWAQRSARRRGA